MNEALYHDKTVDNINAFIYTKTYELAQNLGVGPQANSPEEFFIAISKDNQMIETVANSVSPAIAAATGIPVPMAKYMVKYAIKSTGRDAKNTFKRIDRRNEKEQKKQMQTSALAENTDSLFQEIIREVILEKKETED